ncbi:MAG: substrate-binding domain-containing protein [Cyclobacteriaceae bacterium]|nr:substrate-binding domain-containing protein [Cyclobacteriaceae bacterium]
MKSLVYKLLSILFLITVILSCKPKDQIKIGISLGPLHERWEKDREYLIEDLEAKGAKVIVKEANNDEATQKEQFLDLVKSKVDVIVIVAINSDAAGALVQVAKKNGIKVIAYDRLIKNCDLDYYVAFDNMKVGELQADYLTRITPKGNYAILGGDPKDYNSTFLRFGQMSVLQPLITRKDINVVLDKNVENWDADVAYKIVNNYLKESTDLDAIIASNDMIAKGVCKALMEHELCGSILVSGQDAETDACRRIVEGKQTMTVYKYIESLALATTNIAISLAENGSLPYSQTTINNGKIMVPSIQLPNMIQVTKENMRMTVIADGYLDEKMVFEGI